MVLCRTGKYYVLKKKIPVVTKKRTQIVTTRTKSRLCFVDLIHRQVCSFLVFHCSSVFCFQLLKIGFPLAKNVPLSKKEKIILSLILQYSCQSVFKCLNTPFGFVGLGHPVHDNEFRTFHFMCAF